MPNELSVKAVAAVTGASENPAEPQAELFTPPAHAPPAQAASPNPNPQLRLDPALGLVVIEFRDASGTITTSIPSQRQLDAYRMWEQTHADPAGPAGTLPPTATEIPTAHPTGPTTAPKIAAADDPAPHAAAVHPSATRKA